MTFLLDVVYKQLWIWIAFTRGHIFHSFGLVLFCKGLLRDSFKMDRKAFAEFSYFFC